MAVGTISYSVYLYHIGVQYVLFPRVPLQGVGDFHLRGAISGLLFLAPTLAVAATAYLLVERPCLRWAAAIRRRGKARGRPGSPALSASPRPDSR